MKTKKILKYLASIGVTGVISVALYLGFIDSKTGFPAPITVDGQTIEFTWTDETKGEDLIIYTDKANYNDGLSETTVYVAVENRSGVQQDIELMGYFRDSTKEIKDVYVLTNVVQEREEPIYTEVCQTIATSSTCSSEITGQNIVQYTLSKWIPLSTIKRTTPRILEEEMKVESKKRKSVENFIADKKTEAYSIKANEVLYYKVTVKYPVNTQDNFYFEAIGSEGGMGHLDPWFNASWTYRIKLEIDPNKVAGSSNLTNYPVYLNLANLPSDFHTNVKTDGCDIRIAESDGTTETPFELVNYTSSSDTGELHFKADSLSYNATTTFYVYYGNSGASCYAVTDTYGRNAVWADYIIVSHQSDTENANGGTDFTNSGVSFATSTGIINSYGDYVLASSDNMYIADAATYKPTTVTVQSWVYIGSIANSTYPRIFDRMNTTANTGWRLFIGKDGSANPYPAFDFSNAGGFQRAAGSAGSIAAGSWYMLHGTYDASTAGYLYINATQSGSDTTSGNITYSTATDVGLGVNKTGTTFYLNGRIDEARLRTGALTADWITSEYNNQNSPSTFYWVGTQETDSPASSLIEDSAWFY